MRKRSNDSLSNSALTRADGPPCASRCAAAADSAATGHFFAVDAPVESRRVSTSPAQVRAASGGALTPTRVGSVALPRAPPEACQARVAPNLKSYSLLATGPLCDAGRRVEFEAAAARALLEDKTALQGRRAPPGPWAFHPPSPEKSGPSPPTSNVSQVSSALGAPKAAELVARSRATLLSPALEALEQAARLGYARNFPGLTAQTLRRHPPRSIAAAKGHTGQARKTFALPA